ncbi:MAG: thiamine pyrophosphate-dependent enzyme, partial [Myxococcota bacterium]
MRRLTELANIASIEASMVTQRSGRKAGVHDADRAPFVDRRFLERVQALSPQPAGPELDAVIGPRGLRGHDLLELFRSQVESRHIDLRARLLKRDGRGFYTIGSSGHEGNAAVAAALRPSDPALLHYRSGAFYLQRAKQFGQRHAELDILLGIAASADEPISGGRHKVFGSAPLAIAPQTSTIGSHLPKAVGLAFCLHRAARLGLRTDLPPDAIVACSIGDASLNHSTTLGGLNAAGWASKQGAPMPLLVICEDNGMGISVPTPQGWVRQVADGSPQWTTFEADGLDVAATYDGACAAVAFVRAERRPAFLHLRTVRLLGHAGSDVETMYRTLDHIEATEERDPLIATARQLVAAGLITPAAIIELYEETRERVHALGEEAARRRKLESREEVVAPLAPRDDALVREAATK